jgi:hypothetical protein
MTLDKTYHGPIKKSCSPLIPAAFIHKQPPPKNWSNCRVLYCGGAVHTSSLCLHSNPSEDRNELSNPYKIIASGYNPLFVIIFSGDLLIYSAHQNGGRQEIAEFPTYWALFSAKAPVNRKKQLIILRTLKKKV